MDAMGYLGQVREEYLAFYRGVLAKQSQEHETWQAEVAVQPNATPGADEQPEPIRIDLLVVADQKPQWIHARGADVPEGGVVATLQIDSAEVTVYPFVWDVCLVWFRHPSPEFGPLDDWLRKWLDLAGTHAPGADGLSGVVHYMSKPAREAGGYRLEVDLGSAPVEALLELLGTLEQMGATEICVGRSDGSDLDPEIMAELQKPELSQARLTQLAADLLREVGDFEQIEIVDEATLSLKAAGAKDSSTAYTGNLWRKLLRVGPEARCREMAQFLRVQREMAADQQEAPPKPDLAQLRPVIKDDQFVREVARQTDGKMALAARRMVGDLWVAYVWDQPNGMRFVVDGELTEYGLSMDEAHARAVANFCQEHAPVEIVEHGPLLVLRTGDSYEASLLLDESVWEKWEQRFGGALLACVPARDVVLVADGGVSGAVAAMRKAAADIEAGGDHLVSQTILRRAGKGWEVYQQTPLPPARRQTEKPSKRPWWKFW